MRQKYTKMKLSLLLFLIFSVVGLVSSSAYALNLGTLGSGYFSGRSGGSWSWLVESDDGSKGFVLPNRQAQYADSSNGYGGALGFTALQIDETQAKASGNAAHRLRKQALLDLLKREYGNNDGDQYMKDWRKMGSAFVTRQMIGTTSWDESARTINATTWSELEKRLVDNDAITMTFERLIIPTDSSGYVVDKDGNRTTYRNTAGVTASGVIDAANYDIRWTNIPQFYVWTFKDKDDGNKVVYQLEIDCANPIGALALPTYTPATPASNYSLVPDLTLTSNDSISRGNSAAGNSKVTKTGSTDSRSVEWRITRITYAPGASPAAADDQGSKAPCSAYSGASGVAGWDRCKTVYSGTKVFSTTDDRNFTDSDKIPSTLPGGSKVCYFTSVSLPTHNDNPAWRHSTPRCRTVAVEYSLNPTINLNTSTIVDPGEVFSGTESKVTNVGPDSTLADIDWRITMFVYKPGVTPPSGATAANETKAPCDAFAGGANRTSCESTPPSERRVPNTTVTKSGVSKAPFTATIPAGIVAGSKVCFVTSINRPTNNDTTSVWKHSSMRCVTVRNYELVPTIDISNAIVEPGGLTIVTYGITNNGTNESVPAKWQVTKYEYEPGASTPTLIESQKTSEPCSAFTSSGRKSGTEGCSILRDGEENNGVEIKGDRPFGNLSAEQNFKVPDDKPVGTKICFTISVNPAQPDVSGWLHSRILCFTIGKEPKIQIWGGDVRSGGDIDTSTSTISGATYGSWGEYGALSSYSNSGFASGAGLNADSGATNPAQSTWSRLTFANLSGKNGKESCTFGCYNLQMTSPTLAGQFVASSSDTILRVSTSADPIAHDLSDKNGTYSSDSGNLRISGGTIPAGKTIVIVAKGTVTIEGDIIYADEKYESLSAIPQVIIQAPTINIKNSAGRVDAWLLAVNVKDTEGEHTGVLNTCSDYGVGADLSKNMCDKKLTVNGPVVTDTIYLRRTYGSERENRSEPAEVFNLRADAYLWANARSRLGANQVQTVYTRELSPRF